MGTPAAINDIDEPHTDAMELDPLDIKTSDTRRYAYGNSSTSGITGSSAFSASAP